ncbi:MAG: transcription-repair coupling factor [Lachnospiraceae bacterium]|nr:transcription-repair coupling factor [Lachnospiraceae bacterium]
MKLFTAPLTEYSEFDGAALGLRRGKTPLYISGCTESQKCNFLMALAGDTPAKLVVTYSEQRAAEITDDLRLYDRDVCYYPAKDIIFYNGDIRGKTLAAERMKTVKRLLSGKPVTVVTTLEAGLEKVMPAAFIAGKVKTVKEGGTLDITEFSREVTELGYDRVGQVEEPGQFAVRGSIVDIYPLTEETPYRIDLWDDEIDTIQAFDAESQRSADRVKEITLFPASEFVLSEDAVLRGLAKIRDDEKKQEEKFKKNGKIEEAAKLRHTVEEFADNLENFRNFVGIESFVLYFCDETVSFFDYFKGENAIIFLDEPGRLIEKGDAVMTEFSDSMKGRLEKGLILPAQAKAVFTPDEIFARVSNARCVMLSIMEQKLSKIKPELKFNLNVQGASSYNNSFETLVSDLKKWKKNGYRIVLLSASSSRAARLAGDLRENDIPAVYTENVDKVPVPGEIVVAKGSVHRGFEYPLIKFIIISESDIFGQAVKKKKKKARKYDGFGAVSISDLHPGDYIVHESHGLGIYRGIEQLDVDDVRRDYVKIEYGDGGVLFLPATGLDVIQKYADADAKKPKLNKLHSVEWTHTKAKVRGAVKELAEDLVKLYALRQNRHGYRFSADTEWQREFEEMFPFDETDDQIQAIEDTKRDMESERIMDRLICGDVGYGKTEIALRAAFKAVQDGKQVAMLVPTTILAQQHYNTFSQRMNNFAVNIEVMSRFRTAKEQKRITDGLRKGSVDIVIGTHRLLSKDIAFKDLGLLIVDEEQRFGVSHKERIKSLRTDVDVLTLSATPIPRTLHMSLTGIRDMSLLDEPPVDRMPIQTFVMEHNDEMIREAILRELARGGQVYYVYNRVNGLDELAAHVQELVPVANVSYAHGRMSEAQLEKIMYDFVNGEINVLVSTTIIETGLDISNVNTIIIDDADRLGLSQLYQLRGRVGRSNRTAYSFIMYKRDRMLKEDAEKRLATIREFTELGSGFKIAMRDLEIRGAGNLLGAEQSGHIEAVGYDLYCKLLNAAIKNLKDEGKEEPDFNTEIDFDIDASLPSNYIRSEKQKLELYKRIAQIAGLEDYREMQDELLDRFGEIPTEAENLLRIALLKAYAHMVDMISLAYKNGKVTFIFHDKARLNYDTLMKFLERYDSVITYVPGRNAKLVYRLQTIFAPSKKGPQKSPTELLFEQTESVLLTIREMFFGEGSNTEKE